MLRIARLIGWTFVLSTQIAVAQSRERPATDDWVWNDPPTQSLPGVSHGTIESACMQRTVGYCVFLPPDYEESAGRRYPVVYFLHGAGGTERSDVGFSQLVRRQIEDGRISPVVYVFVNGGKRSGYRDWSDGNVNSETMIIEELIPHIDQTYRTIAHRRARALLGFSMGGGGALRLGTKYSDRFCAAASFAAAIDDDPRNHDGDNVLSHLEAFADPIRDRLKLMMVVGDEDFLFERHQPLVAKLKELAIPHQYVVLPGESHNLGRYTTLSAEAVVQFLSTQLCTSDAFKFDVAIQGGRIVDGTGAPWYVADLGIQRGRITKIGRIDAAEAETVIRADGLIVAPGFVDMMGQTASPLIGDPGTALNLLTQGITTINAGEGGSAAPLGEQDGLRQGWTTMSEYFSLLESQGLPVNVVQSVGHTQVRQIVLGDVDRRPNADELERMKALVREAMEAGAIGVSTALIYPPAVYARTDEISALVGVAGGYGGRYYTHIRNEGDQLLEAIEEALEIGRQGNAPVHIFHLKAAGQQNWGKMPLAIAKIKAARALGHQVTADIYPYINNGLGIAALIHPAHFAEGSDRLKARLDDDELRSTIRTDMESTDGWENWYRHAGRDWNRIIVGASNHPRYQEFDGRSVAEIARSTSEDPWDTFFELVRSDAFVLPQTMSDANKIMAIREPFVSFCTDVGPAGGHGLASHPRAFGAFPRLLARYVRDLGVISLEQAIAQASATATNDVMVYDRGRIAEGLAADLVVFDYEQLADRADFTHPRALSEGVRHVLVNGTFVLKYGTLTEARPGRVLRGPGFQEDVACYRVSSDPVTLDGGDVARFASFDRLLTEFIKEHRAPGVAVAMTRGGKVVFARGYGYADIAAREKVEPASLFRIASLSKPITAVAILQLAEQGRLQLTDRVLSILDFEADIAAAGESFDPHWRDITIEHLLEHRGGWDRDVSFDAMFQSVRFARQLGTDPPADQRTVIRAMLSQKLDFEPGARYAYSNFGYCLLGRVIEVLSDQDYASYVKDHVLAPLGVTTMRLGATRLSGRAPGEVRYYQPGAAKSVFAEDLDNEVPRPYGAWNLEAMDAHGGWIASALDLARFAAAFDDAAHCPILGAESIERMYARPDGLAGHDTDGNEKDVYYSLGWLNRVLTNGQVNHWHTGSLDGTSTILIRRGDGTNLVGLLNTRASPSASHLGRALDRVLHEAANEAGL